MLHLQKGQTSQNIVLTLQELQTLTTDYKYKFVFVNTTTKETVTFFKTSADDLSTYPSRYNEFTLNTQTVFGSYNSGEWLYTVYETNLAETVTATLEKGKMYLKDSSDFTFTQPTQTTSYITYER